jgi:hypothetical protein
MHSISTLFLSFSPLLNQGVPLNDSANLRLQIAEVGQAVLGSNLLGLQVGNEPDLYAAQVSRNSIRLIVNLTCLFL